MATPIFACGAECGIAIGSGPHFTTATGTTSFDTGTVRTGLRSLRVNPTTSAAYYPTIALASTTDWVVRFYIRFATLPSATSQVCSLAGTVGAYFNASDSKIYAGSNTSTLGASGVSVTTGVWYRIDLKLTSTTVDVQVDGSAVGQLSGSFGTNSTLRFGGSASSTRDSFYDDILISQTTADYPLGAGFVKSYIPNADGTHNVAGANDFERTLTGTDITNATTTAYQLIDDRPLPSTADDFINGIAPPNDTDYVEWTYETSGESNDPRHVEGLLIHHDAGGAGTNNWTVTLRRNTGGASSDIWTGTTNVGATITGKRAAFAQAPGSVAWTTAIFNDLRSRFLVSDASPDVYLDAVMLEAEFPEGFATQNLTPALINQAASPTAPTVTPGPVNITLALLDRTASPTAPTLTSLNTIAPALTDQTAAPSAPTVSPGPVAVAPALLDQTAAPTAPIISAANAIGPALIDQSAAATAPTISTANTIAPALTDQTASASAPTVTQEGGTQDVTPALIEQVATATAPVISATSSVAPGLVDQTASPTAPTVTPGAVDVAPALTDQTASPTAPAVSSLATISPALVDRSAVATAPAITTGSVDVAPALLDQSAVATAPTVSQGSGPQEITTGLLDQSATTSAPTISSAATVAPPLTDRSATASAPTVSTQSQIAPTLVDQSANPTAPVLTYLSTISLSLLDQMAMAFAPAISGGAAWDIALALVDQTAVAFAPSVTGGFTDLLEQEDHADITMQGQAQASVGLEPGAYAEVELE